MVSVVEQVQYERELQERGARAYFEAQDTLREKGRAENTDAMRKLFKHNNQKLVVAIEALVTTGWQRSPYKTRIMNWLPAIPFPMLAYFAQSVVMQTVDNDTQEELGLKYVCQRIGEMIETEAKCQAFKELNAEYYDEIQKSFKQDKVSSYDHKRKVINAKLTSICDTYWDSWGMGMRVGIGTLLLRALLMVYEGLLYTKTVWLTGSKSKHVLCTSVEFDEWLADYEQSRGLRTPLRMPMKVPPCDWDLETAGYTSGGYLTPAMRMNTPFINPVGKRHREFINKYNPVMHKKAANKLQKVPFEIDREMLDIISELWSTGSSSGIPSRTPLEFPMCPLHIARKKDAEEELTVAEHKEFLAWKAEKKQAHRDEVKRRALVRSFVNTLNAAKELVDWDEFYYVWTTCFRGRFYQATAAMTQQGHESARSLIRFKNKKPLGERGMFWLKANGGNLFGVKGDRQVRAQWVDDNIGFIRQCAEAPMDCLWKDADKPLHFLAWCLEYKKCGYGTNTTYSSGWIGGIDGTNNGLQHLSAIARDPHGALMTNLTAMLEKQDAYNVVAEAAIRKFRNRNDGVAELWLKAEPGRDLAKMPMMILVYGASKQTCKQHCIDWVHENADRFDVPKDMLYDIAVYGANTLWEAICEEIPEIIALMQWLQMNATGRFVAFISQVGFPVFQYYMKAKEIPVHTSLMGIASLTAYDIDDETAAPNNYAQRNGIVPNFVHSLDSAHLVKVVLNVDFETTAIHDEYLAHCCDLDELQRVTVVQFHDLHKTDVLKEWARQQGISDEYLPPKGSWDVDEVLLSQHLFE